MYIPERQNHGYGDQVIDQMGHPGTHGSDNIVHKYTRTKNVGQRKAGKGRLKKSSFIPLNFAPIVLGPFNVSTPNIIRPL